MTDGVLWKIRLLSVPKIKIQKSYIMDRCASNVEDIIHVFCQASASEDIAKELDELFLFK